MPVKSARQAEHLRMLNSLPSTAVARFQKGREATNKVSRITVNCFVCGKLIQRKQHDLQRSKRLFCSHECRNAGRESPVSDKVCELYNSGMSLKAIAAQLGHTVGTTAGLMYRKNAKERFKIADRTGDGKTFVKNRLPKQCELCGYNRIVELAHIIPARKGGVFSLDNCYALCPNCHHLFDHGLLTEQEKSTLNDIYASRKK